MELSNVIMNLINLANTHCWQFVGLTALGYILTFIFAVFVAMAKEYNKKFMALILCIIDYILVTVSGIAFYISLFCVICKILLFIL